MFHLLPSPWRVSAQLGSVDFGDGEWGLPLNVRGLLLREPWRGPSFPVVTPGVALASYPLWDSALLFLLFLFLTKACATSCPRGPRLYETHTWNKTTSHTYTCTSTFLSDSRIEPFRATLLASQGNWGLCSIKVKLSMLMLSCTCELAP